MNITNPLSTEAQRIVKVNAGMLEDECPNPDCDLTPDVADVSPDGRLYVSHEEDGVGLDSRTERGETDGCLIAPSNDPTL